MPSAQRTATEPRSASGPALLADPLLASTFRKPAVPRDMVVRRRLADLLRRGVHGPLTLVSAPAGFGKTVLVASWATEVERSGTVAYLSLDDGEVSAQSFWASVLEGLRRSGVDVPGTGMVASLAKVTECIAAHREPVVVVLDCGERALSPMLGDGLRRLLNSCAGALHVVLLTRTDPPLPLHRYRLEGAVTEIRAEDLAFTATEVAALMQHVGIALDPVDVAALRTRTGGWPAGLKFAAMSLAGRADTERAIRDFRGDTGNVAEYLMSEVLAKQPPETREFLLRTCIVDELDPGLVEALTGRRCDQRALRFMAHGNSFVEPVPSSHGCYRYQSLFREFLRSQLSFEQPALVPALHRLAARWFADNEEPLAAVQHAVSAQAWGTATRYFVDGMVFGGLLTGRNRPLLSRLFAHLPADVAGVEAAVTRAALALTELDTGRAAAELRTARMLLDTKASHTPGCGLAIVVLDAVTGSLGADLDAALDTILDAESALQPRPADDVAAHPELKAVVAGCKGRVLLRRGDFAGASAALTEGVKAAQELHLDAVSTELQGMAALVAALAGHLGRATELAHRCGAVADDAAGVGSSTCPAATLALAWVRTDEYDLPEAQSLVAHAEGAGPSYDAKVLGAVQALLRARLSWADGGFDLARAELRAARASLAPAPAAGWLDRALVHGQAASLVAEGRPEEAATLVRDSEHRDQVECALLLRRALLAAGSDVSGAPEPSARAIETAPLGVQIASWLVRAQQSVRENDTDRGEAYLERALGLAAPEHFRRPFFEAPDEVRRLLEHSGLRTRSRWLGTGVATSATDAAGPGSDALRRSSPAAAVVNPLTAKEQEVLGYLAQLMTTDEIAKTMFVSVNTVRSHVRSILRKLGVTRRNEAVRRAWELRLLPPRTAA